MKPALDLGAPNQEALDDFALWIAELEELEADFDDFVNDDEFISAA